MITCSPFRFDEGVCPAFVESDAIQTVPASRQKRFRAGEGNGAEQLALERHLKMLDAVVAVPMQDPRPDCLSKAARYSAEMLIHSTLAAHKLRDKSQLRRMLSSDALQLLPPLVRKVAGELMQSGAWRIPTWESRHQLMLDSAMMMVRRESYLQGEHVRFGLADSSLQACLSHLKETATFDLSATPA